MNKEFFIGIDLGGEEKRTTGICIIDSKKRIIFLKDIFGKNIFKTINSYLENTKAIAIDAPLTKSRGRGKMRLFEKFLSTSLFRKEKVTPIPPALMPEFHKFAMEVARALEERGFVLGINLIEVFPTLIRKICREEICSKNSSATRAQRRVKMNECSSATRALANGEFAELRSSLALRFAWADEGKLRRRQTSSTKTENHPFGKLRVMLSLPKHQESAFLCAQIALLHSEFKTRWFGYKDGFLFLPAMNFWKKEWLEKFFQAWQKRNRLKYHHLITNFFE